MLDTRPLLIQTDAGPAVTSDFPRLRRSGVTTVQVNLGYLCNLSCTHCHVNAGPKRTELMDAATVELVLDYLRLHGIRTLDMTGGAPEMNPHFRHLVTQARLLGVEVIDRCNLTILGEPGYEDMAEFLAQQQVVITASLPCYLEQNVEKQRGKGVYGESIRALKRLNALGYGRDPALQLNLVYNPDGLSLPPAQDGLEATYKRELFTTHSVVFNQLFTITNMPISRFGGMLLAKGWYQKYMDILRHNYSAANLATVMCRTLISVDYQGFVYDCDFNQMLQLPLIVSDRAPRPHLADILRQDLAGNPIATADHCYGCTAGQGSSCGGALSD
ncbi:MAG: arsenosugar biosynthesis radical SAM protein ArsS [Gammaproteobacteria bacterium]|nr:arsenosugar biosynthesis radical SAM protein ArsS [Gammaproteobacteria bacterium]